MRIRLFNILPLLAQVLERKHVRKADGEVKKNQKHNPQLHLLLGTTEIVFCDISPISRTEGGWEDQRMAGLWE